MMWFRVVVLCALAVMAYGIQSNTEMTVPKPDYFRDLRGCYIEYLEQVVPFGLSKPIRDSCIQYFCTEDWITTQKCSPIAADAQLVVKQDVTKPFPHCCPEASDP